MSKKPNRGCLDALIGWGIIAFIALVVVASIANMLGLVGGGYGRYNTEFYDE